MRHSFTFLLFTLGLVAAENSVIKVAVYDDVGATGKGIPCVEVIAGMNLPMLVKLARVRGDMEIKAAVTLAAEAGRKYINVASDTLGG